MRTTELTPAEIIEKVRQLSTFEGYFVRFFQLTSECVNYRAAWERLEKEREEIGLQPRYNSYQTFRTMKRTYHRIRIEQAVKISE